MLTQPSETVSSPQKVSRRAKLRRLVLLLFLGLEMIAATFFCSTSIGLAVDVFPHGDEPTGLLAHLTKEVGYVALSLGVLIWVKDLARFARLNRYSLPSVASPLILHILIISACTLAAALAAAPIMGGIANLG